MKATPILADFIRADSQRVIYLVIAKCVSLAVPEQMKEC